MLDVMKTYAQIKQNKLVISNGNKFEMNTFKKVFHFETLVPNSCSNIGCTSWCEVAALPKTDKGIKQERGKNGVT